MTEHEIRSTAVDPAPADSTPHEQTLRSTLAWADLPGHHVGLYGLGVEGQASLRKCRALGIEPVIVDDSPADDTVLRTSAGGLAALLACEVVIKSPGISRYAEPARALDNKGVAVTSGLNLWLNGVDRSRVLLVTGTKGKSTTSAIAAHLLRGLGFRVLLGGNIGVPPFDPDADPDADYYVVEVSSYQATDLAASPPVTAVTSLDPDHLPWHGDDVETYYRDKLSATAQPGACITVVNGDSATLRAHAAQLGGRAVWVYAKDGEGQAWLDGLGLIGEHNRRNALIARRCLVELGVTSADDDAAIAAAAQGFSGLPHRLQVVGRRGGVTFIDDGLSTNVLPALAAVDAFPERKVALLVGGMSRGIDYGPLAAGLRGRAKNCLVVTMPSNGRDIHTQMEAEGIGESTAVIDADSLEHAVRIAADWAEPDGVVLLSPAAPSFDLFRDYQHRSSVFLEAVRAAGA